MSKVQNKLNAHVRESQDKEFERQYSLIKQYAKENRVFIDKVLEETFSDFIKKHKLGEVNEQLKSSDDRTDVPEVPGN